MGLTLRELRYRVGRRCGDLPRLVATDAGNANAKTFVDDLNLFTEGDTLSGSIAVFVDGTPANVGQRRRVVGNTKSATSITFARALPAQTQPGDVCELYALDDVHPRPDEIDGAINDAIEAAAETWWDIATGDAAAFDKAAPQIALSDQHERFAGLQYHDEQTGAWEDVPESMLTVDGPGRTVLVEEPFAGIVNGRDLRARYVTFPAALEDDDAETDLDPEWIGLEAASRAMLALARRLSEPDSTQSFNLGMQYRAEADGKRGKARKRRIGRTWRLG